jgi:alpha-glucosidase
VSSSCTGFLWLTLLAVPACGAGQFSLASPDRTREIVLRLDETGRLTYQVNFAGKTLLENSPLGIVVGRNSFVSGLKVTEAGESVSRRERYELFSGITPKVDRVLNHRSVRFRNHGGNSMIVDLAASDEGIAFRYRFDSPGHDPAQVLEEQSGFQLPPDARAWLQPYHTAGKYTPAYEDFYFHVSPGDTPPHSREKPLGWGFPALFEVPSAGSWLLITEVTGADPYPACHLAPDSSDGLYRVAFPRENEQELETVGNGPAKPHHQLPWTLPWRAILIGADAAEIATATLVTDLAPPSRIADVSWIKPGRASWAWWSHPEGPFTAEAFNQFTDFSAEMGWEYTLFDANWWDPGIKTLVQHATRRNVRALMWTHARDYETPAKRVGKLDEVAGYGAVGVKADFWCSDRQESIGRILSLFEEAAKRKLLVNLHGCTLPRGWHRTWPNFMTAEAVLGAESYLYESAYSEKAAELNTVLPFTRNVAGPMDYTPFTLSPKRYPRLTTAAHELANAIICTSGIVHYADSPEVYRNLPPEVVRILRDAPARWDETRCLIGDPGRIAVFARRFGDSWFIAGISGSTSPQSLSVDLAEFGEYARRIVVEEGNQPRLDLAVKTLSASDNWQYTIPPRGGFVLRLEK